MLIGELLVSRGLISRQQLEDALLAQKQFGGRLGTNLVEMGAIGDDQLAACLSQQLKVPWVRPAALASIPRDVINKVPKHLAEKFRTVPIKYDLELHVCMCDAQNFERLDEMAFALGIRVRPYVVTETTLNYALERYYGIRRETRQLQSVLWDNQAPKPPTTYLGDRLSDGPISTPTPTPAYTRNVGVLDELSRVMSADDIVRALLRYFADLFPSVIILSIEQGRLAVAAAVQTGRQIQVPAGTNVPVTRGSLFEMAATQRRIVCQPQSTEADVTWLCGAIGIPANLLTAIPVMDGDTCHFLVVGQGRDEAKVREVFAGLQSFLAKVVHAMRIVLLRNEIIRTV